MPSHTRFYLTGSRIRSPGTPPTRLFGLGWQATSLSFRTTSKGRFGSSETAIFLKAKKHCDAGHDALVQRRAVRARRVVAERIVTFGGQNRRTPRFAGQEG